MTFSFGSLFAGIGGFDLGLERAGMECRWQVEIDDYCQKVLAKHWPNVRRFGDVKEVHGVVAHANGSRLERYGERESGVSKRSGSPITNQAPDEKETPSGTRCPSCLPPVDLVCGGFPCQPHSVAGKRKGAADDRNLWPEFSRIVGELRPRWVVAENVPGIVTTYLDTVLSDLEGQGYACGTFNLPACAFDAPHRRERIFIVAHSDRTGQQQRWGGESIREKQCAAECDSQDVADAEKRTERAGLREGEQRGQRRRRPGNGSGAPEAWAIEPDVGRVAHGIPNRVDRLRALGNAVVPQVVEWIGRRIMETGATA